MFTLIRGDATSIPLADDSVDLVVTSPPYRRQVRGPLPVDHAWLRPWRLVDWRGATLRPATPAEVERFRAAHDQDRALSSRAKVKAAVR